MGQIVSRKDSNAMKGTSEPPDPLTDAPELSEKYAITNEKFGQLISQKEQVPTGDVVASSPIYSSNLVEDLKQKLKESDEVCDETLELNRSLSFLQLADEKEKAQLTFTKVAEIQEEPDKNKALEKDIVKSQFSKLLRVSNSLIDIEEKKTQLEEERAAIIEKHGEELATLKDLLAAKPEELTTEDRRILSVMEATETLQPEMHLLKQRLDSYEEVAESAQQRTLHYYETTMNVTGNCSTSSSIMEITAEYNFEMARPKSSTDLVRTITTDVEIHSLSATEKSTLRPIAVGATNERPAVMRTYQKKIRARESETETIAPRAKRRKIAEPVEPYRCDDCGKTYRQYKSLSMHIKEDCGKPSVECENCRITFQPFSYRIHTKIGICSDARRRNISMRNMHNILHMLQEKLVTSREALPVDEFILLLRTRICSIDHEHLATFFSKLHCFQKKNEMRRGIDI